MLETKLDPGACIADSGALDLTFCWDCIDERHCSSAMRSAILSQ
jgi:hypothetical protein